MSAKQELISKLDELDIHSLHQVHYLVELIRKGKNPYYIIPDSVTERLNDEQRAEVEGYYNSKFGRG